MPQFGVRVFGMILLRSGVFLLLILLAVAGCKRDIRSGDFGPLTIGQSKLEALAALKAYGLFKGYGLWMIEPVPYNSQYVVNPTRDRLAKLFSEDAGIYVRWSRKIGQAVKVYSTG